MKTRLRNFVLPVCLGVLNVLISGNAWAIEANSEYMWITDYVYRSFNKRFKPEFSQAMVPNEIATFKKVKFVVIPYADFNAFSDYSTNTISLPEGLLFFEYLIATAETFSYFKPDSAPKLAGWLEYLRDKYVEHEKTGMNVDILPFPLFIKYDESEVKKLYSNHDFSDLSFRIFTDTVALITAHELGHIINHHKPYSQIDSKISYKQEYEADEYAANLLNRAKTYRIDAGAVSAYLFFALLEGGASNITHPPATCRIARLCNIDIDYIESHPEDWTDGGIKMIESVSKVRDAAVSLCENQKNERVSVAPISTQLDSVEKCVSKALDQASNNFDAFKKGASDPQGAGCVAWDTNLCPQGAVSASVWNGPDGSDNYWICHLFDTDQKDKILALFEEVQARLKRVLANGYSLKSMLNKEGTPLWVAKSVFGPQVMLSIHYRQGVYRLTVTVRKE